jgi:hypothetical protein
VNEFVFVFFNAVTSMKVVVMMKGVIHTEMKRSELRAMKKKHLRYVLLVYEVKS